jgi:hypothetical protein
VVETNVSKTSWSFYLAWVALNFISILIAFAIYWALISLVKEAVGGTIQVEGQAHITEDFLLPYIFRPVLGLVIGVLQYILLRLHLPRMGWWIVATILGWLLGLIGSRLLYSSLYRPFDQSALWIEVLLTALIGLSMGIAQWLVLRQRVPQAGWWIVANLIGWGVIGWGAATITTRMVIPAVSLVTVPGIITGVTLWWLLDRLPQRQSILTLGIMG